MKQTSTLTKLQIAHLIYECRNAELFRDMTTIKELIEPLWDTISVPDFSNQDEQTQAELYRICGFYQSFYGHQKGLKDFQSKGKDLISIAIRLFEKHSLFEYTAEARVMLAFSFWNSGEVEECEIILNEVEAEFSDNPLHPIFFQINCNRLMTLYWQEKLTEAEKLIEKMKLSLSFCNDSRLLYMFHNQAGIIFQSSKKPTISEYHYQKAIKYAKDSDNQKFVAINYNNLAMLLRDLNRFDEALQLIENAEKLCAETGFVGFLPHVLDTKSLIFLSLKQPDKALSEIEKSLDIFREGEDYRGFVEAIWTKINCLIKLQRKDDALLSFCELRNIAAERIGTSAVEKYGKLMADQIIFIGDAPLDESEKIYRQERISMALRQSGGVQKIAAHKLGIGIGKMSDIISNQFPPETFADDGYKKRKPRLVAPPAKKKEKSFKKLSSDILKEKPIAKILFANMPCTFDFEQFDDFDVFLVPESQMKSFGINYDCLIAAEKSPDFNDGDSLLIRDSKQWILGEVEFDEEKFIYFITAPQGRQIEIELSNIAGKPIAFCPYSENLNIYTFSKLSKINDK